MMEDHGVDQSLRKVSRNRLPFILLADNRLVASNWTGALGLLGGHDDNS